LNKIETINLLYYNYFNQTHHTPGIQSNKAKQVRYQTQLGALLDRCLVSVLINQLCTKHMMFGHIHTLCCMTAILLHRYTFRHELEQFSSYQMPLFYSFGVSRSSFGVLVDIDLKSTFSNKYRRWIESLLELVCKIVGNSRAEFTCFENLIE